MAFHNGITVFNICLTFCTCGMVGPVGPFPHIVDVGVGHGGHDFALHVFSYGLIKPDKIEYIAAENNRNGNDEYGGYCFKVFHTANLLKFPYNPCSGNSI